MSVSQKVLRCLMLTASNNDHEALVAIRKANQLLACLNLNWEEYLGVAIRHDEEDEKPPRRDSESAKTSGKPKRTGKHHKTAEMFAVVKAHLEEHNSEALDFIRSLERGFSLYGSLTAKQDAALKKFYKNATRASF